jgi:hypothetical protein
MKRKNLECRRRIVWVDFIFDLSGSLRMKQIFCVYIEDFRRIEGREFSRSE